MSYYWLVFRIISFTYHNLEKLSPLILPSRRLYATWTTANASFLGKLSESPPTELHQLCRIAVARVAHYFTVGCFWVQVVISLSPSKNILGWYLWIGHDRLLPHNFQFIFVLSYHAVQPKLLKVSLNKHRHKQLLYIRFPDVKFSARGVDIAEMEWQWSISAGY